MRGSKEERAPGVWRLRVFMGRDPDTGNVRQATRTFRGTKRQADSALADLVHEVSRGGVSTDTSTVAEYLDRWLEHISPTKSPTTLRGYRGKIRRINAKLGKLKLNRLTAQHLDRTYREWLEEGLHPTSVHHIHAVISAALNQAVKWGLVDVAAATATATASPPRLRVQPKKVPSASVVQQLIAGAESRGQPVLAAAIAVATTTGARRGELLGLRWSDIDLDRRLLSIERSIKHDDGPGWVVGATKTHAQRRIGRSGASALQKRSTGSRCTRFVTSAPRCWSPPAVTSGRSPGG